MGPVHNQSLQQHPGIKHKKSELSEHLNYWSQYYISANEYAKFDFNIYHLEMGEVTCCYWPWCLLYSTEVKTSIHRCTVQHSTGVHINKLSSLLLCHLTSFTGLWKCIFLVFSPHIFTLKGLNRKQLYLYLNKCDTKPAGLDACA
jgi:hypothetical protein